MGSSGLGIVFVSGLRRVPKPAARIMAFMETVSDESAISADDFSADSFRYDYFGITAVPAHRVRCFEHVSSGYFWRLRLT